MTPSLQEICNLIADQGVKKAESLRVIFATISSKVTGKDLGKKELDTVFKIFSFLNWAYANGMWSNLSNTELRRDLMAQSGKSIVLKLSFEMSENKENSHVAMYAVNLEEEFRTFAMNYIDRLKQLERSGHQPDANTALLYGLECLQDKIGFDNREMDSIVPTFLRQSENFAEIEKTANQINLAFTETKRKGFFARLFGS
ncbi:MAG: hypothetical protein L6428_07125 [Candidatus Aminicenantes bacterium]|nr:hypothetical protein [Candidatus Aminicenantes bacterium]